MSFAIILIVNCINMGLTDLNNLSYFISWDFLMAIGIFIVFIFLGFFWKKKRILTIILSFYLARLFLTLFSLPSQLKNFESSNFTGDILVFWALSLFFFFLFTTGGISLRTTSLKKRANKRKKTRYLALKGAFYGFFAAGLFISFSISLMSVSFIGGLSLVVNYLFAIEVAKIAWAIFPIIAMIAFN